MNTVSKTVSDETLNCIIQIESGGRPTIKAPTSSALGLGQFLNATWLNTVAKHRPDIFHGTDGATILSLRLNPSFSIEMLARFTEDNQRIVGMDCTPGDLYLAHFLGAGAAQRVCRRDPGTMMEGIVTAAAIAANRSIMQGKTAGQVRAWAARRMAESGGHDWVAKYYIHAPGATVEPAEADKGTPVSEEPDEQDTPPPRPVAPPAPVVVVDGEVTGDPDIYSIQKRLKDRHYSPGKIDGKWGSGTAGAVSGFINDRGGHIPVPASVDAFAVVRESIKLELTRAESEGWYRPVTEERKAGAIKDVAKIAPEVLPVHQNFLVTLWGSIAAAGAGLVNAVSGYVGQAWDFYTGHKDDLPTDPGVMSKIWGYVTAVPSTIWIMAGAGALLYIALNSRAGVKKITESVQTGDRQ